MTLAWLMLRRDTVRGVRVQPAELSLLDGNMPLIVARAQRAQGDVDMGGWDGRLGNHLREPHSKQDLDLEKGVEVLFTHVRLLQNS